MRIANKKQLAPRIASASSQSEISASAERAERGIATAAVFLLLSGAFVENRRVDWSSVDFIVYSLVGQF